jgi:hypothetical protein
MAIKITLNAIKITLNSRSLVPPDLGGTPCMT